MNLLQWLAGADKDILQKCSRSERIKFTGYGTLVLIPAIVGLISMTYAISTVVENKIFYVGGGIVWFFIVLFIDRFIISTMHKSRLKNGSANFALATIARYSFAILIGFAVSHPMTLLWFDGAITESLKFEEKDNIKDEEDLFIKQTTSVNKPLEKLYAERKCLVSLRSAEYSGDKITLDCGSTTGKTKYGPATEAIQQEIDKLDKRIHSITVLNKNTITKLEDFKNNKQDVIKEFTSYDYLKRVQKLDMLMEGDNGDHIKAVYYFIIIFFIFLDILPITMKISTAYGEYESYRDTQKFKVQELEETEREVFSTYAKTSYTASAQAKYQAEQKIEELSSLTKAANDFVTQQEFERKTFSAKIKKMLFDVSKLKESEDQQSFSNYIINSRHIFKEAISKAQSKFLNYLKGL